MLSLICASVLTACNNEHIIGPQGPQGEIGEKREDGLSAYEIYIKHNPEYEGTEEERLNDLANGNLKENYKVTWLNYDGFILEVDENVTYNSFPSYNGAVPTRESDDKYDYIFDEWSPVS